MKILVKIAKILIYVVGLFLVGMAFSCFGTAESGGWLTQTSCFVISITPGVLLMFVNYILRNKQLVLGVFLIIAAIGFFFLFQMYKNIGESWPVILVVFLPTFLAGIILIADSRTNTKEIK